LCARIGSGVGSFEHVCDDRGVEDRLEPLLAARAWALPPEQVAADLDVLVA
jgi:hypothetical protein